MNSCAELLNGETSEVAPPSTLRTISTSLPGITRLFSSGGSAGVQALGFADGAGSTAAAA